MNVLAPPSVRRLDLDPSITRFLFLRHGRTAYNLQRIVQGHTDIPLDAVGREQAVAAAELLAGRGGIARIVSSDLSRASATAQAVASRLALPLLLDPDLRERGFGPFEGGPAIPGLWSRDAEDMETLEAFSGRIARALSRHLDTSSSLLVAHGGVLRVLGLMLGVTISDDLVRNAAPLAFSRTDADWQVTDWQVTDLSVAINL
ncbi:MULTISPECIES: histidine phosphatase family protein [unclassified Chelatococcus]|uniref:histidine phosphatase family protein n=1 Tax=unclassified Chelatococcus TaxID=2638111 RepID=UPI001BCC8254|nr:MULTISPECIES: histidine phosphatase family protein [unclassified Chelatococcus]CAH1658021.1 Histidine phosphatase family protein [Hyphomicrobiales bacterium]MBS7742228.1 histidine phosphatase family protein [Chelatococcus sp. HY11]MBX3542654.1 histidine phosphatase family protein [Chelatococcus sp.]MCO5075130.1 histidine phosphatase family protein [Chelatococcus sp.]CAH1689523.1 Histidine phosphatase family protein [Hyphomicrobiales bacterium]